MTAIISIGSHIPPDVRDARAEAVHLGVDPEFVDSKLGTRLLPVLPAGEGAADLATAAVRGVMAKWGGKAADVRVLVLCTQSPEGEGLPHTSAIVQHRAGLSPSTACFDISLGCSGYVYGLSVVEGMLASVGGFGLLVTADPYSKMLDRSDRDTALLFGDAGTATLLGPDGPWRLGRREFGTDGSGATALERRGGRFRMAGRQVFNFAATRVPAQVRAVLDSAGLSVDDIDLFALHQGSRYIVETIADRLGAPRDRVPVELSRTGNTVSSSIPLLLQGRLNDPALSRIILSGFGVGLSWGSMLIERGPACGKCH
jgi:3-oxoacyl-[acyl-carrier-protein] synthase-3